VSGERPRVPARGEATGDGVARGAPPGDGAHLAESRADEPPPIAGRWSRLYALVLIELAVCIALGLWLTRAFR
jgi:hypothetical protein